MGNISFREVIVNKYDKLVKVWSVSDRKEVASLAGHASCVYSVAFMGNINCLNANNFVKVWS
jgi:hypothetical protein